MCQTFVQSQTRAKKILYLCGKAKPHTYDLISLSITCNLSCLFTIKKHAQLRHVGEEKGWGVLAGEPVKAGSVIIQYTGEVVTKEVRERGRVADAYSSDDCEPVSASR